MSSSPDLAIVIVTWNAAGFITGCLSSVQDEIARSGLSVDVWVTDNDSSDGTADRVEREFPAVHLVRSGANLGFAGGNNLALRQIGFPAAPDLPRAVLLLNPDTIVRPGAFTEALAAMAQADAGLVGAALFYEDGSFQHGVFRFPGLVQLYCDLFPVPPRLYESALNGRYRRDLFEGGEPFLIDFPLGAFFLLRCDVIQSVGMFDDSFWLYCEEIDWALRIRAAGYRAVCAPRAHIIHLAGKSTAQVRPRAFEALWNARIQLFSKHYPPLRRRLARWLIGVGISRRRRAFAADPAIGSGEKEALLSACDAIIIRAREVL